MTQLNGNSYSITATTADSFTLNVDTSSFGEFSPPCSNGMSLFEASCLAATAHVPGTLRGFGSATVGTAVRYPSSISKANPAVVTAPNHGFNNGDVVRFEDVGGMTQLNGQDYKVGNVNAAGNTFELKNVSDGMTNVDSTNFGTFTYATSFSDKVKLSDPMSSIDDFYNGYTLIFSSGPGVGQSAVVNDYVRSTRVAHFPSVTTEAGPGTEFFLRNSSDRPALSTLTRQSTVVGARRTALRVPVSTLVHGGPRQRRRWRCSDRQHGRDRHGRSFESLYLRGSRLQVQWRTHR